MEYLEHNPLFVVAIIAVVIWLGFFVQMFRLEKRLRKLEQTNH